MFVYWGKHKGAIFHASAQGPKIPRSDPRKRRKHLNAQSQKEKSPFCRTSSRSLTLMSSCPPDLCADPTFLAMLLSIPNPAAVVKDIVKSSIFAKKCIESQAKALFLCLEGAPPYLVSFMACLQQIPECLHYPNPRRQSSRYLPSSPLSASRRQSAHAGPMQPLSV